MKRQKLFLHVVLFAVLMVASASGYVFADPANAFDMQFDKAQVKTGDIVSGKIYTESGHITNGTLRMTYDDAHLQLLRAEKSAGQEKTYASVNTTVPGVIVVAFASEAPIPVGDFIQLEFQVRENLSTSDVIQISMDASETYDENNQTVQSEIANTYLTVAGGTGVIPEEPGKDGDSSDSQGDDKNSSANSDTDQSSDNGDHQSSDGQENSGQDSKGSESEASTNSQGGTDADSAGSSARTGDTAPLWTVSVLAVVSVIAVTVIVKRRAGAKNETK